VKRTLTMMAEQY